MAGISACSLKGEMSQRNSREKGYSVARAAWKMDWVAAMEKKRGIRNAALKKKQVRPFPRERAGIRLGLARPGCHTVCRVEGVACGSRC